ncbi:MAG: double-strand break repair protein AddB [Pseudomonadota bacterium]
MFDPVPGPRIFTVPLGVDFPKALVDGLRKRTKDHPPEALGRVQLVVNTRRMARRIRGLFDDGPPCLLPDITLITQPGETWHLGDIPEAVSPLRRRLELVQLVTALLDKQPDLAPRSAIYDLSDSLVKLMDEMHGEGVPPHRIDALDISDQSGHWARIRSFLSIIRHYFEADAAPDPEDRQRRVIEALIASWKTEPPQHPVIIAGSTGSRGTTQALMQAVAQLPQGAVVLPGFDDQMPDSVWHAMAGATPHEDHPQYRFAALFDALNMSHRDVLRWVDTPPAVPARNAVLSLALRPAPVTDQWLTDGPKLRQLTDAFADVTLVEAPSQRLEALTIAMRLREAAQIGEKAALITPDRGLTRQVSAALDRWDLLPDDSAGIPLHLSAPGRFLRHVSELLHRPLSAELLLTILKHPLTHSASDRGPHLRLSRELELHLRRYGPPYPTADTLRNWAATIKDPFAETWGAWVVDAICAVPQTDVSDLADLTERHIAFAERIAAGTEGGGSGKLWDGEAGREARKIVSDLAESAHCGGDLRSSDYASLFHSILSSGQVRSAREPHPNIMIWGTLEARVQGADLIILAGLNEGSWPEAPAPDPWLNRDMRRQLGLLLPDRRIGLSAHDFQQAALCKDVFLTRSLRSDDAETVPSRWLNRLQNLLSGLPEQEGEATLKDMRARGEYWMQLATQLEQPIQTDPAKRPAPCPPTTARPKQLSVTQIKTLIRDPYAIYARHVLGLRPLDALMRVPDALLRGTVIHKALEDFIKDTMDDPDTVSEEAFLSKVSERLDADVPWAEARLMWHARVSRSASRFVEGELARRVSAKPVLLEAKGKSRFSDLDFTLTAEADRIDVDGQGRLLIYDYKTGEPPNRKVQTHFDKQLLLEAAIAERDGFGDRGPAPVAGAIFIGLGSKKSEEHAPIDTETPEVVWQEFHELISVYFSQKQGYAARRAPQETKHEGDYDHLARFGEWNMTDDPDPEVVG